MLAIVALVFFIITAVVAWVDKTVTVSHLIALLAIGLAFIAGHLAFRVWGPNGHW
jgi:hypothetical protein